MRSAFRVELLGEIDDVFVGGQRDSCRLGDPENRVVIPGRVIVRKNGNAIYLNSACIPEIGDSSLEVRFTATPARANEDSWSSMRLLRLSIPLSKVPELGFVDFPNP